MFKKLISNIQTMYAVIKARQRIKYPIDREAILGIADVPVFICNTSVLAVTGVPGHIAGGTALRLSNGINIICLTEACKELPTSQMYALIAHEYAHLFNGDVVESNHYKEIKAGVGFAMEKEYRADAFALSEGHDILGLLEHTRVTLGDSKEICNRISAIKKLMEIK